MTTLFRKWSKSTGLPSSLVKDSKLVRMLLMRQPCKARKLSWELPRHLDVNLVFKMSLLFLDMSNKMVSQLVVLSNLAVLAMKEPWSLWLSGLKVPLLIGLSLSGAQMKLKSKLKVVGLKSSTMFRVSSVRITLRLLIVSKIGMLFTTQLWKVNLSLRFQRTRQTLEWFTVTSTLQISISRMTVSCRFSIGTKLREGGISSTWHRWCGLSRCPNWQGSQCQVLKYPVST